MPTPTSDRAESAWSSDSRAAWTIAIRPIDFARGEQQTSRELVTELNRQLTLVRCQQDQLSNLRLLEEIDQDTFAGKATEFRDRIARLNAQIESSDRSRAESGQIAIEAFEGGRSSVPSVVHLTKRRHRIRCEGKCPGRSFQRAPLRS